jgi:hypothetical protein
LAFYCDSAYHPLQALLQPSAMSLVNSDSVLKGLLEKKIKLQNQPLG